MQNLYIIRHMETVYNQKEILQGWSDSPLTPEGLKTLRLFAQYFQNKKIDKIVSSPFPRCLSTAQAIAQKMNLAVEANDNLKEICYGNWEEQPKKKFRVQPIWEQREQNRFRFKHPGVYQGQPGESYYDLARRLRPYWPELVQQKQQNILIVSHIGVVMAAKKYFGGLTVAQINQYRPPNNMILHVQLDQKRKLCQEIIL